MSEPEDKAEDGLDSGPAIVLPAECGLVETEVFIDALNDADAQSIVIDASLVEKMSAPCAMAVISAVRHAEANSAKIAIVSAAPPFVDAFSDLGLFQDLMKMEFRQ